MLHEGCTNDECQGEIATLQRERDAAMALVEQLKNVLHLDRSGLAAGLAECRKIAAGWTWIVDGRGSYEWDDERYQRETDHMITAIIRHCNDVLEKSGNLAHAECCGRGESRGG